MHLLTAIGALPQIKAAADEFDRHDPSPADAVSWYEAEPGRFRLEIYAPTDQDAASAIAIVGAAAPDLHVVSEPLDEDTDWIARSLEGLPPVEAGRFVVAGAHVLGQIHDGRRRIWIEASEAFGTGHHGTTKGCLLMLERAARRRRIRRALDVGAGSGVLAIAAAKLGADALAIEIDPRAAEIAALNVRANAVSNRVRVRAGDGARLIARERPFDLVFANILMRPLIRLAPRLIGAVAPGGDLILSGLLTTQEPLVRAAYVNRGMRLVGRLRRESWATLALRRPLH